jgi:hypothetical protein
MNCKLYNMYIISGVHTGGFPGSHPPRAKKKKKIFLLLMTCNIFIVSILGFEHKIYNCKNIMIIK